MESKVRDRAKLPPIEPKPAAMFYCDHCGHQNYFTLFAALPHQVPPEAISDGHSLDTMYKFPEVAMCGGCGIQYACIRSAVAQDFSDNTLTPLIVPYGETRTLGERIWCSLFHRRHTSVKTFGVGFRKEPPHAAVVLERVTCKRCDYSYNRTRSARG